MTYSDGYYYLMTTTWTNLQITRAKTLEGLKTGETRVVWTDANPSRCCNVWAPELHKIDNTYVSYLPSCAHGLDLMDSRQVVHLLHGRQQSKLGWPTFPRLKGY
jgi:GH43 family beta-xylosidase